MLDLLRSLPDQLKKSEDLPIPDPWDEKPEVIVFAGMGGSGISGMIARIFLEDKSFCVLNQNDYNNLKLEPQKAWFFSTSYSGNTEETVEFTVKTLEKTNRILVIASGGELIELAKSKNLPYVQIPKGLPPRQALGYLFGVKYNFLKNAGLIDDLNLYECAEFLREKILSFEEKDSLPFELAYKFYLRIPVIYTTKRFSPIAFRWKTQLNENSKVFAHTAEIPEMNHNEITGIKNPRDLVEYLWIVFLRFTADHTKNLKRIDLTNEIIRDSVMGTTVLDPDGDNLLQEVFYYILMGDYISYYLSLLYQEDPFEISRINLLKEKLQKC